MDTRNHCFHCLSLAMLLALASCGSDHKPIVCNYIASAETKEVLSKIVKQDLKKKEYKRPIQYAYDESWPVLEFGNCGDHYSVSFASSSSRSDNVTVIETENYSIGAGSLKIIATTVE